MSISRYALCFLLLGAAFSLSAQKQKKEKAGLPDNVERTADIVYATYGDKQLHLDLYMPKPKPAGAIPGIVVIRGGGWRQGDKNGFAGIAAGLAAKGLAAACIEYRVLPDVTIADAVHDTKAAVRWMRAEGKRYGIQTDAMARSADRREDNWWRCWRQATKSRSWKAMAAMPACPAAYRRWCRWRPWWIS